MLDRLSINEIIPFERIESVLLESTKIIDDKLKLENAFKRS